MASGQLSPRQKMINLMYLVLLALLAMQVSVEVMETFSKLNDRAINAIDQGVNKNTTVLLDLKRLSEENPSQYKKLFDTGEEIASFSKTFIKEIGVLKTKIEESNPVDPETGKLPATEMGKGDVMDAFLFKGDKYNVAGQKFVDAVDVYRKKMLAVVSEYPTIVKQVNASFKTDPVKVEGIKKPWLDYNFKGLPAIGTMAVLSSMENEVLNLENETLSAFISGRLMKATSASNLQAFVKLDKTTYNPGDKITAEVFLASKDDTKVPNKVEINGQNIDLTKPENFKDGKVIYPFKAGAVGDRPIVGSFTFLEKGNPVVVEIKGNYSVVPSANQAVVSADKMNVVYRGIENPITISMAGISANKINAKASGLKRISGSSYMLRPGRGKTVDINVSGTTDSGDVIKSPPVTFRIKDVPAPMASIRGKYGSIRMPKSSLAKSSVAAGLPDFVFDLKLRVQSFKVKVPGKTTVIINGQRMNSQVQKAIASARRGDIVTIFGMRASIIGNSSYKLKEVLPISVEISN